MEEFYCRTAALLGEGGVRKLAGAHVALFGLGGVGSYAAEALARCGVGELTLTDADVVSPSNLNRQLVALRSTVGRYKTEVMQERIADINPDCKVHIKTLYFDAKTAAEYDFSAFSYVADAIDSVADKVRLIASARAAGVPVVSCMGAGTKLGCAFRAAPLEDTKVCPLARIVRRELKKTGITGVKAIYSEEPPEKIDRSAAAAGEKFVGSVSFVPASAGLMMAGEIVRDLVYGK